MPPALALLVLSALHPQEAAEEEPGGWRLEVQAVEHVIDPDSYLLVIQNPVFRNEDEDEEIREVRATWCVFWLDREAYEERGAEIFDEPGEDDAFGRDGAEQAEVTESPFNVFEIARNLRLAPYIREVYLEGPVEFLEDGELIARAGAIYVDQITGHGWIAEARLGIEDTISGRPIRVYARADWLRHSADGTMHAKSAIVTPCGFAVPHMHIRTRDLEVRPKAADPAEKWEISLRDNDLNLYGLVEIPLPPIRSLTVDRDFNLELRAGDSARYGPNFGAAIVKDWEEPSTWFGKLLFEKPGDPRGDYSLRANVLGSRGALIDAGTKLSTHGNYLWEHRLGIAPDFGDDRGTIRVDEGDRNDVRLWYRSRGRFQFDPAQWIDVAISRQSDPGVQSEFFESDFYEYEQRDNFLHYRIARGTTYAEAAAQVRLEDWRRDVQEIPSGSVFVNRHRLLDLAASPLLFTSRVDAGYFERLAGDAEFASPFENANGFGDLLGERDIARADTTQRVELPISTGVLGLRFVPFAEARMTAWSEGVEYDDQPLRFGTVGGAQLRTSFWNRLGPKSTVVVSPFVEARKDLGVETTGGDPVRIDPLDDSFEGSFLDFGLRGYWLDTLRGVYLDAEVRTTYADDTAPPFEDGWETIDTFVLSRFDVFDVPFGFSVDQRHDAESGQTRYSLVAIGLDPTPNLGVELNHRYASDAGGSGLFEAAEIVARYRWTEKWELEGRQTFSLSGSESLESSLLVRRYGHDLVFDVEISERLGEGGTSVSFNLRPVLAYHLRHLGVFEPRSY